MPSGDNIDGRREFAKLEAIPNATVDSRLEYAAAQLDLVEKTPGVNQLFQKICPWKEAARGVCLPRLPNHCWAGRG